MSVGFETWQARLAWMISLDWHRLNFQFLSKIGVWDKGIFGTDSSLGPKWRNVTRFRFKFGL